MMDRSGYIYEYMGNDVTIMSPVVADGTAETRQVWILRGEQAQDFSRSLEAVESIPEDEVDAYIVNLIKQKFEDSPVA